MPEIKYTNCLYMLNHETAYDYDGIKCKKIGSSKHLVSRMYNYKTYYPIDKEIICFFYLNEYDCYQLDDDIKIEFNYLRIKSTGGIEYYKRIDSADIEKYLIKRNIQYEKYFYVNNLVQTPEQIIDAHKQIAQEHINYSNYLEKKNIKPNSRDEIQDQYVKECEKELISNSRVFIKVPVGFGKTHIFYKLIKKMGLKKVLFLTPKIFLNEQLVDEKYSKIISADNYSIIHFSDETNNNKEQVIESLSKSDSNYLLTSCYQSANKLFEYTNKYDIEIDLIVYDEAHLISYDEELLNNNYSKYKIFGSSISTPFIKNNSNIFGKIVEYKY